MAGARALAEAGRPLGRAAVIGEPTGLKPIRLHKGVMMERIDDTGRSGHSLRPQPGQHSALDAMRCNHRAKVWRRQHRLQPWVQRAAAEPQLEYPAATTQTYCGGIRWVRHADNIAGDGPAGPACDYPQQA